MLQNVLKLIIQLILLLGSNGAGGFFWGSNSKKGPGSDSEPVEKKSSMKASSSYSSIDVQKSNYGGGRSMSSGAKLMPSITDVDDSNLYISEDDLSSVGRGGGYFAGSSFGQSSRPRNAAEENKGMKLKNQRRRDIDADEDYNYDSGKSPDKDSSNRKSRKEYKEYKDDNTISYDKGEIGLNLNHFEGGMKNLVRFTKNLPKVNLQLDPVINFKLKQKISHFGACITLGMDYLSELAQWRAYCAVEDTIVGGRFSLRGSELGWTKSWFMNLGLGEESTAKIKLRMGLNLKSYKAYARVRFRTEPLSTFDIGEGLSCAGKVPLPGLLPILRSIPLRVEYRLRINTPQPDIHIRKGKKEGTISLSTGIDRVDLSLDELNFCLEWDERSPVWGIGLVRSPTRRALGNLFGERVQSQPVKGVGAGSGSRQNKPPASSVPYPA